TRLPFVPSSCPSFWQTASRLIQLLEIRGGLGVAGVEFEDALEEAASGGGLAPLHVDDGEVAEGGHVVGVVAEGGLELRGGPSEVTLGEEGGAEVGPRLDEGGTEGYGAAEGGGGLGRAPQLEELEAEVVPAFGVEVGGAAEALAVGGDGRLGAPGGG